MALKAVREGVSKNKDQATGSISPKPIVVQPTKPGVFEFEPALSTVVLREKPTLSRYGFWDPTAQAQILPR